MYKKCFLILILNILVISCGFAPLSNLEGQEKYSSVCFNEDMIESEDKILKSVFFSHIDKFFKEDNGCKYQVKGKITAKTSPFILNKESGIERYDTILNFDFDLSAGKFTKKETVKVESSFSKASSSFATYYSEYDMKKNLIENLVEELRYKIILMIEDHENKL